VWQDLAGFLLFGCVAAPQGSRLPHGKNQVPVASQQRMTRYVEY
jgi:hypothetical protein